MNLFRTVILAFILIPTLAQAVPPSSEELGPLLEFLSSSQLDKKTSFRSYTFRQKAVSHGRGIPPSVKIQVRRRWWNRFRSVTNSDLVDIFEPSLGNRIIAKLPKSKEPYLLRENFYNALSTASQGTGLQSSAVTQACSSRPPSTIETTAESVLAVCKLATQCLHDQVEISSSELNRRPELRLEELKKHLLKENGSPCLDRKTFENYEALVSSADDQGWSIDPVNVLKIIEQIEAHRAEWVHDTKYDVHHQRLSLVNDEYIDVYVDPKGGILLDYKRKFIGSGASKNVYNILKIKSGKFSARPKALQLPKLNTSSPSPSELRAAVSALLSDYNILKKIQERKNERWRSPGNSIEGLLPGKMVKLAGDQVALIQTKFDGDLYSTGVIGNRATQPLAPEELSARQLKVWTDVASGLVNLHEMNLVHGDLKPENILYDIKKNQAVITDYGLTFNPSEKINPRTTAYYEAPEMVAQSRSPVSHEQVGEFQKRDIYSFGMILHQANSRHVNPLPSEICIRQYQARGLQWSYDIGWSGGYGACLQEQSRLLYEKVHNEAQVVCQTNKDCLPSIIADCLQTDPKLRPSSRELKKRLNSIQSSPKLPEQRNR